MERLDELVLVSKNGNPITNTKVVAEVFGKEHKHVLEAVKRLAENSADVQKLFYLTETQDRYGRNQPMYIMNRDGFSLLVMGFTGEKALDFKLQFINAFNQMEKKIREGMIALPQNYEQALEALLCKVKENKQLALENKQQAEKIESDKSKVNFAQAVMNSEDLILIRDLAHILKANGVEIGELRLFQWLREQHYLCMDNTPTQKSLELGVMRSVSYTITTGTHTHLKNTTKITTKGQQYFINKFITKS